MSNSGKNEADGLTPITAWQTIAHLNSQNLSPGDNLFFECRGIWRKHITLISSGSPDNYIVYTKYGSGANPEILGSEVSA